MCYMESDTLTLAGMLADPMIRAVMRSDGVSEHEFSSLLFRVRAARVASGAQRNVPSRPAAPLSIAVAAE